MLDVYKNLSLTEKERIIKFILCTILSFTAARIVGHPTTSTIAVSAILMLYIDRGYLGSLQYNRRRVQIQVVMGLLSVGIIYLLRTFFPFLEDWIICIIVSIIGIVLVLPFDYRYKIAPLPVTLGNAAFIMVTGIVTSYSYAFERIMFCIIGAGIGYAVNYFIMPQRDRLTEIKKLLASTGDIVVNHALSVCKAGVMNENEGMQLKEINQSITELQAHVKNLKQDTALKRHEKEKEVLDLVDGLCFLQDEVLALLKQDFDMEKCVSENFQHQYFTALEETLFVHKKLLNSFCDEKSEYIPFLAQVQVQAGNNQEILLWAKLLEYRQRVSALIKSNNICYKKELAQAQPQLVEESPVADEVTL